MELLTRDNSVIISKDVKFATFAKILRRSSSGKSRSSKVEAPGVVGVGDPS